MISIIYDGFSYLKILQICQKDPSNPKQNRMTHCVASLCKAIWMYWHRHCPCAKRSLCKNIQVLKFPCAKKSFCGKVHMPKSLLAKISRDEMSACGNIPVMKCSCGNAYCQKKPKLAKRLPQVFQHSCVAYCQNIFLHHF